MSKKKQAEIVKERNTFINGDESRGICGAVKNGVSAEVAGSIYDEILDFANYAFNKSHAVAYAVIAYQTAYLKCHYPKEYMAALMSSVLDSPEKVAEYTAVCREMGIAVLPPDINESEDNFTVSGEHIRYGLVAVKNIGRGFIRAVMNERNLNGKFTAFDEFCERMYGTDLNRRAVESLIKCGGFDSLGYKRSQLLRVCDSVIANVASERKKNLEGQLDFFGTFGGEEENKRETLILPDIPELDKREMMIMEKETTGLYLSGHPMDEYRAGVKRMGAVQIGEIIADFDSDEGNTRFFDNDDVLLAGVIASSKTRATKNNSLMAYIDLDDGTGTIEMLAFQRALDTGGIYIRDNTAIIVRGKISVRDEKEPQILVDSIRPITDLDSMGSAGETTGERASDRRPYEAAPHNGVSYEQSGPEKIYVKVKTENDPVMEKIRLVLNMFPGTQQFVVYFEDSKKRIGKSCVIHEALIDEMKELLGEENVVVK